jgi:formate hydrogenlyase subunit 4
LALSSLLAIAVLLTFPLYFRSANESFATGTLDAEKVGAELRRWSSWHWARTFVAIAAFVAALLALGSLPYDFTT